MKKFLSAATMLAAMSFGYAQVGINTTTPNSTLDITAKNPTGTSKNVDGLLIPRVDRERAQSMSSVPTSTLVYVNDVSKGTLAGTTINVDTVGYYYFDGKLWVKLNSGSGSGPNPSVNIYNSDGTLTGNRTVTQGDKTLTFTGTATNAFSVDGNTFSVDAANDRVGIGTSTPLHKFHAVATTPFHNRFALFDAPGSTNGLPVLALRNTSPSATGNLALLGFTNSGPTSGGANWGIGSIVRADTKEDFYFGNSLGAGYLERMRISAEGNVGIGTTTPTNTLDVNGKARVRTTDAVAENTVSTPVHMDANGVLVRMSPTTFGTVITSSSASLPSGATGTLVTGLVNGAIYKAVVQVYDGCVDTGIAEYYINSSTPNNFYSITGLGGSLVSGGNEPTFNKINRATTQTTWAGKVNCQDGGNATAFNYTLSMPSAGTVNVTNNGNVTRKYTIILTRMN